MSSSSSLFFFLFFVFFFLPFSIIFPSFSYIEPLISKKSLQKPWQQPPKTQPPPPKPPPPQTPLSNSSKFSRMPAPHLDHSLEHLKASKEGFLTLHYEPRLEGVHELCLHLNGHRVEGGRSCGSFLGVLKVFGGFSEFFWGFFWIF